MAPALSPLRTTWQTLYSQRLPSLARSKDPAQKHWPVTLDHCFGRIILDKVVGRGQTPWNEKIKGPAVRNMSDDQVEQCIELGEKIAKGDVDLVELDEESLRVRGKKSKAKAKGEGTGEKRKREVDADGDGETVVDGREKDVAKKRKSAANDPEQSDSTQKSVDIDVKSTILNSQSQPTPSQADNVLATAASKTSSLSKERALIRASSLTDFQKRALLALCQIPRGQYSTYAAMSDFLKSSPRAVGNAMRENPFDPAVPCHRVLAADGKIGGFKGTWGEGEKVKLKMRLLREEGVKFDGKGRVVGSVWRGFK